MKYDLRLYHNNKYIVLDSGSLEYCENMLKWFTHHSEFFNGNFKIVER